MSMTLNLISCSQTLGLVFFLLVLLERLAFRIKLLAHSFYLQVVQGVHVSLAKAHVKNEIALFCLKNRL